MTTRREFITRSAAASVCLQYNIAVATDARSGLKPTRITRLAGRDDTIVRVGGVGGFGGFSWAADDRQYTFLCDGTGVRGVNPLKIYHSRLLRIVGDPQDIKFEDVVGYPDMLPLVPDDPAGPAAFWPGDCLAVDGHIYQYLTTPNHPYTMADASFWPDFYWTGVKLIYSPDNGRTWHNQDGSSPVVWEKWKERSKTNMVFFDERPQGAFTGAVTSGLSILQMGRNYELNKDGYVYVYSMNGIDDRAADQLVMFRVRKTHIRDRQSYEFFSGMRRDGSATWMKNISARTAVHTFPSGNGPAGDLLGQVRGSRWQATMTYNGPLNTYMMTGMRVGVTPDGKWFNKPSYLGIWTAPTPWGPFRQVHEDSAWTPGNDPAARVTAVGIPPKWIASDGRSFWLVWSDYQYAGDKGEDWNPDEGIVPLLKGIADKPEGAAFYSKWEPAHLKYWGFNMQRFDIEAS